LRKKEITLRFRETAVPGDQETLRRLFDLKNCVKRLFARKIFLPRGEVADEIAFFLTGAPGGRMMGPYPLVPRMISTE
jgi:hypothetical protein